MNKKNNHIKNESKKAFCWKDAVLLILSLVIVFRLVVWKLIPRAELFIKEDGCNLLVATSVLLIAFIVGGIKFFTKQFWVKTGFETPISLLIATCLMSLFFTIDLSITIRVIVPFLGCIAFFYTLVNVLDSKNRCWFLLWVMIGCAVVTSLFALWDLRMLSEVTQDHIQRAQRGDLRYILNTKRATSFIGWPNSLAGYLLLTWPLLMGMCFFFQKYKRYFFILMAVIVSLGLLATFSFLGWSSLLISCLVMMPFLFFVILKKVSLKVKVILGVVALLMGIAFGVVIVKKNFSAAIAPRLIYYDHSIKLIQQKPWQGHGLGTYGVVSRPFVENGDGITSYPHNTYLQWWIEGGVLGFVGIIWFMIVFIGLLINVLMKRKENSSDQISWLLGWGLLAFFIDNFFSFTFFKPNISFHAWAMLAIFVAWGKIIIKQDINQSIEKQQSCYKNTLAPMLLNIVIVLLCAGLFSFSLRLTMGCFWYWQGFESMKKNDIPSAGESFVKGSLYDRWSSAYPVAAGNLAIAIFRSSQREYYLRLAEQNYLEAARRQPHLYAHYFVLADIYQRLADPVKQAYYDQKAQELSPYEYRQSMSRRKRSQ